MPSGLRCISSCAFVEVPRVPQACSPRCSPHYMHAAWPFVPRWNSRGLLRPTPTLPAAPPGGRVSSARRPRCQRRRLGRQATREAAGRRLFASPAPPLPSPPSGPPAPAFRSHASGFALSPAGPPLDRRPCRSRCRTGCGLPCESPAGLRSPRLPPAACLGLVVGVDSFRCRQCILAGAGPAMCTPCVSPPVCPPRPPSRLAAGRFSLPFRPRSRLGCLALVSRARPRTGRARQLHAVYLSRRRSTPPRACAAPFEAGTTGFGWVPHARPPACPLACALRAPRSH